MKTNLVKGENIKKTLRKYVYSDIDNISEYVEVFRYIGINIGYNNVYPYIRALIKDSKRFGENYILNYLKNS